MEQELELAEGAAIWALRDVGVHPNDWDDALQEARLGMWLYLRDGGDEGLLPTVAKRSIIDYLRAHGPTSRSGVSRPGRPGSCDISDAKEALGWEPGRNDPELERAEDRLAAQQAVQLLEEHISDPADWRVLDGIGEGLTLAEIARQMEVTAPRISQRVTAMRSRMRRRVSELGEYAAAV